MSLPTTIAAHLTAMFATNHNAKSALWSGSATPQNVLFGAGSGDPFSGDEVRTSTFNVIFPSSVFVGITGGDTFAIESSVYRIVNVDLLDDGEASRATLSKES